MGSVRKLQNGKVTAKSGYVLRELAPDKGKYRGMILGAYISWRSPMRFYYAKMARVVNVKRHVEGQRNFYSYYHRRYVLSRQHALRAYELSTGSAAKRIIREKPSKREKDAKQELRKMKVEKKERKHSEAAKKPDIITEPLRIRQGTPRLARAKQYSPKPDGVKLKKEKPVPVKTSIPKTKVRPAKTVQPKPEIIKCVKKPRAGMENIVVKDPKIRKAKRVETSEAKPVSKSVKSDIKAGNIYKPQATKKEIRTSAGNCARGKEDGRQFASNRVKTIALPVRRPFATFFELSIEAAKSKMPPEEIIRRIDRMTGFKAGPCKKPEEDAYHLTNNGRRKLFFPKIASGAADSV